MNFQYSPFIPPLIFAFILSGWLAYYTWTRRNSPQGIFLSVLALAINEWLLSYALEIAGADLPTKLFFGKISYIGITTAPLMWFTFAYFQASKGNRLSPRRRALLSLIPALTTLLAFTNDGHGLIWSSVGVFTTDNFSALEVTHGPWFWVHAAYSYILLAAGAVYIFRSILHKEGMFRFQSIALLTAVFSPWLGNAIYLLNIGPFPFFDPTPFAFTISLIALTWGVLGFQLINLSPVARDYLVEHMSDGMIVCDAHDVIIDLNPGAQKITGRPAKDLIGRRLEEMFSTLPETLEKFKNSQENLGELKIGVEAPYWYELHLSLLKDKNSRKVGSLIAIHDVTERKRSELRLSQLSRAVEASPASIVITDLAGLIQYVNPKFTQVTGYTAAEALGQSPRILKTEFTPQGTHQELWRTITAGSEWHGEFCNRKKDGEIYWESASISPICNSAGVVTHYVAVKEDITARKQADEALALARDQALEASQFKSQLLAKVSHELRTPLGAILGFTELMQMGTFGPLGDQQAEVTAQIVESVHFLNGVINDLLDEAQISAQKIVLHLERFSLHTLLKNVESNMNMLAGRKNLSFNLSMAPDLPEFIVGDERRIQQVFVNLAGNAIKYTLTGQVCVNVYRHDRSNWGIQVRDTGVGIPHDALQAIFEPFHQVAGSAKSSNRGTGLGLTITKQLAELMGGKIIVQSEINQGSTFTVILPLIENLEKPRAQTGHLNRRG